MTTALAFGLQLPQGFFGELRASAPQQWWELVAQRVVQAERAGFVAVYANDHLLSGDDRSDAMLEGWTTLAAISQHTTTMRLGQLVLAAPFRNPALVAKMVATLDVISGGRAELGIGAGWLEREFDAFGYPFPGPGERITMLEESLEVIRRLWTRDEATFEGRHHTVRSARCLPRPLQARVPILVGAFGRRSIGVLARHGDRCNFMGTPRQYARRVGWLEEACERVGRDPAEIDRTLLVDGLVIGEDERAIEDVLGHVAARGAWPASNVDLAGTPEQLCEQLDAYAGLGISEVMLRFADDPDGSQLELFRATVMSAFTVPDEC